MSIRFRAWRLVSSLSMRRGHFLSTWLGLVFFTFAGRQLPAHDGHEHTPIGQWFFWPEYVLEGRAANYAGPRVPHPKSPFAWLDVETPPLRLAGGLPTERLTRLIPSEAIPSHAFSVEVWLVDHVNQPVGAIVAARGRTSSDLPGWALSYHDGQVSFWLRPGGYTDPVQLTEQSTKGFKKYWHHLVATYDGDQARLYINGERVREASAGGTVTLPPNPELEIAAYLGSEQWMSLANLVREVRIYNDDIGQQQVRQRYAALQALVEEGRIFADRFHFTAGPALTFMTRDSAMLVWETDRPATAIVQYGVRLPCELSVAVDTRSRIQRVTLPALAPETPYFYEVMARTESGEEIRSGPLTFKTAVRETSPYTFAILGDTEARPHVNDRLAKAVWGERPDFILNVGDLTDGGQEHHKFEWNLEYFLGMNQVLGRIPMFPVPGNGESDLHWYRQYLANPQRPDRYGFAYGNAEFFMLDSNRPMGPGSEQYAWLDQQLGSSRARWKFVAHHHPVYSSDDDDHGDTFQGPSRLGDDNPRSAVDLYEKHGVDIVFYGHIHAYERTWPVLKGAISLQRGIRYIQTGGGGGNLEGFAPTRSWFSGKLHRGYHYCLVNIHEGYLRFQMFDLEGRLRDAFEINK